MQDLLPRRGLAFRCPLLFRFFPLTSSLHQFLPGSTPPRQESCPHLNLSHGSHISVLNQQIQTHYSNKKFSMTSYTQQDKIQALLHHQKLTSCCREGTKVGQVKYLSQAQCQSPHSTMKFLRTCGIHPSDLRLCTALANSWCLINADSVNNAHTA